MGWFAFDATARAYARQKDAGEDDRARLRENPEFSVGDDSKAMEFLPEETQDEAEDIPAANDGDEAEGNEDESEGSTDDSEGEEDESQGSTDESEDDEDESQDDGDDSQGAGDEAQNEGEEPQNDSADATDESSRNYGWLLLIVLLLAMISLLVLRLIRTDPLRMVQNLDSEEAAAVLFRANLMLLEAKGIAQQCGETAYTYAGRSGKQLYVEIVRAYCEARYAQKQVKKKIVEKGIMSYNNLYRTLNLREKLRYTVMRLWKGVHPGKELP